MGFGTGNSDTRHSLVEGLVRWRRGEGGKVTKCRAWQRLFDNFGFPWSFSTTMQFSPFHSMDGWVIIHLNRLPKSLVEENARELLAIGQKVLMEIIYATHKQQCFPNNSYPSLRRLSIFNLYRFTMFSNCIHVCVCLSVLSKWYQQNKSQGRREEGGSGRRNPLITV